jgi:hypothetical protein
MENEDQQSRERCTVCGQYTVGGFQVSTYERKDGSPIIAVDASPGRDFSVCEMCNDVLCLHCSAHPDSGYCNGCYKKLFRGTKYVGTVGQFFAR